MPRYRTRSRYFIGSLVSTIRQGSGQRNCKHSRRMMRNRYGYRHKLITKSFFASWPIQINFVSYYEGAWLMNLLRELLLVGASQGLLLSVMILSLRSTNPIANR